MIIETKCKDDLNSLAEISAALCNTKGDPSKMSPRRQQKTAAGKFTCANANHLAPAAVKLDGKQKQLHHPREEDVASRFLTV